MSTETAADAYRDLDTWPYARSLSEIVASNARAVEAVQQALPALERAAQGLERSLLAGGRLVYIGAGTSGRLALQDAAELPPTFGFDRTVVLLAGGAEAGRRAAEGAEDDAGAAVQAVDDAGVSEVDTVVGLAASGRTPYTIAGLKHARQQGAFTVGMANNPDTPLLAAAEVAVLLETGPEVLAGSTRLAAGTAQKVALNALSTAVLVRLGGAYRNLMVGMRPVNEKLFRRAVGIVREATGQQEDAATEALNAADWDIRGAIVMLETGCTPQQAREVLERHGHRVREVLTGRSPDEPDSRLT
jgi:N-acetylmuramic acid 6-phosphate etherase